VPPGGVWRFPATRQHPHGDFGFVAKERVSKRQVATANDLNDGSGVGLDFGYVAAVHPGVSVPNPGFAAGFKVDHGS